MLSAVASEAQLTPWGLVGIFVLLIAFGGLIPRWMHNQRIRDKEKEIVRLHAVIDKRDEQVDKLIKQGEVTVRLLEDLKAASKSQGVIHS